jgi:hypothetical protein
VKVDIAIVCLPVNASKKSSASVISSANIVPPHVHQHNCISDAAHTRYQNQRLHLYMHNDYGKGSQNKALMVIVSTP